MLGNFTFFFLLFWFGISVPVSIVWLIFDFWSIFVKFTTTFAFLKTVNCFIQEKCVNLVQKPGWYDLWNFKFWDKNELEIVSEAFDETQNCHPTSVTQWKRPQSRPLLVSQRTAIFITFITSLSLKKNRLLLSIFYLIFFCFTWQNLINS